MGAYSTKLRTLAYQLMTEVSPGDASFLFAPLHPDVATILACDRALGGPSIYSVESGGVGLYDVEDRDVFRPLQYIRTYLCMSPHDFAWVTREIVHTSGLHIEALVQRVGDVPRWPLGRAIRSVLAKRTLNETTWLQICGFSSVYNAAKHEVAPEKDVHLFDSDDAVLAYLAARLLARKLLPYASLRTDLDTFR